MLYIIHAEIDWSIEIDRSIQIKVAAFSVSIALRKRQAHLELAMSGDVRPTATTLYRVAQGSWSGKRVGCTTFSLFTGSCELRSLHEVHTQQKTCRVQRSCIMSKADFERWCRWFEAFSDFCWFRQPAWQNVGQLDPTCGQPQTPLMEKQEETLPYSLCRVQCARFLRWNCEVIRSWLILAWSLSLKG